MSTIEKMLAIGAGVFIIGIFLASFITDLIENWRHWLIWFGAIGFVVGIWVLFS